MRGTYVHGHNIPILMYSIKVDQQACPTQLAKPMILLLRMKLVFLHLFLGVTEELYIRSKRIDQEIAM